MVLKLKLERKETEVVLESESGEKTYTLRELSGKERNTYLNKMKNRAKVDSKGNTTITSFDGLQSDLLCLCFFNDAGELVSKEEIENLPASTQQDLFDEAQKLSGLDNSDIEKND
jgi:hypothetical protein